MENLIFGFLTGGSLILAIGPQNLFVIDQGLKEKFCIYHHNNLCCFRYINFFLGIFIYHIFDSISLEVEVIFKHNINCIFDKLHQG